MKKISFLLGALALVLSACTTPPKDAPAPQVTVVTPPKVVAPAPDLNGGVKPTPLDALRPPPDLWERIRRGYKMPNLETDLVIDREQWYAARPDYFGRMSERSSKYLYHIVEELEKRNMPTELALLPFIESAFNPQAVSSAKAAGMWQFMPATGKYFDLKQNTFKDDRRSVLHSTRAALDYLQKLHDMFGDWHLALAAYNWGEGSVARAIKRNQAAGLPTGYTDLTMPQETRYYVPKFQAVKNIIGNPERYQVTLPHIANHPYFASVKITRDIDVTTAAQLAQVPLADFRALNPSANKPVITAAGTPEILLPYDNAQIFQQNIEAQASGKLASWTAWVVPSTMRVAEAARRVGMPEDELRSANKLPRGMLIKAGSTLLVTRTAKLDNDISNAVADNARIALTPEMVLRRRLIYAARHETVAQTASRHGFSASKVGDWNNVDSDLRIRKGQALAVYQLFQAETKAAKAAEPGIPKVREYIPPAPKKGKGKKGRRAADDEASDDAKPAKGKGKAKAAKADKADKPSKPAAKKSKK